MIEEDVKKKKQTNGEDLSYDDFREEVLEDYRIANESRTASVIGRKEVLTGKAKFGIFGAGKEVAQLAMAKVFQKGDFRSGYYRDQTFMFAAGIITIEQLFAQLYAHPDLEAEPSSAGRQMDAHFATRMLDENGEWKDLTKMKNSAADSSPISSQMPRALGLGMASKHYRKDKGLKDLKKFSDNGNEVAFCTLGDATVPEGMFLETLNAAGVEQVPIAFCIWDDGYGISVPKKYQTTKENIAGMFKGFEPSDEEERGVDVYYVKGWDYPNLCKTFEKAISKTREEHSPCLIHVDEVTQPQGHSTSGSHERYKSEERLEWEEDMDPIKKMREWILEQELATEKELDEIEEKAEDRAKEAKKKAWEAFREPIKKEIKEVGQIFDQVAQQSQNAEAIKKAKKGLENEMNSVSQDVRHTAKKVLRLARQDDESVRQPLIDWKNDYEEKNSERYDSHLYSQSKHSALQVEEVPAEYDDDADEIPGYEILNKCFDIALERDPRVMAFGEDVGYLGDVNQAFAGMQDKYGELRVFDTGIREATIIGQGIGLAQRGLRPIAEIQYLDYLIFGLQPAMDDLATLHYRTKGGQKAPMIIRTRGHRLEGIWHTGSPMGMVINSMRGVYVLVIRNMTQAAGLYNTMPQSDDPALIVEPLNGYRIREKLPSNLGEFTVPLGQPEVLEEGDHVTLVTYGSCVRIAQVAMEQLEEVGISCELVDVQTLVPFDLDHKIVDSLKITNRVVFIDEDVPGGATAYMKQQVMEEQQGYYQLDAEPRTVTAEAHRSAYGSDGDYFSKPNAEDIFEEVYELMHEFDPQQYPIFY
jgi:pyruvate/2-oxoglutarate/acetoin dehydrogenase E1 component/TPP-dependent pyruvate/acetoin dehydrogenase alpha subunit